jgi:hypothetical protein
MTDWATYGAPAPIRIANTAVTLPVDATNTGYLSLSLSLSLYIYIYIHTYILTSTYT